MCYIYQYLLHWILKQRLKTQVYVPLDIKHSDTTCHRASGKQLCVLLNEGEKAKNVLVFHENSFEPLTILSH